MDGAFVPNLSIANGTTIQANYSFADGFKPILRSDSLRWGDLCFYDVGINGEPVADHYLLQMKSDRLMLGQLQMMDFGTVRVESSQEMVTCRLLWQNSSQAVGGGDVNVRMVADSDMLRLVIDPSHLALGGRDWNLIEAGENYYSHGVMHVDGIGLRSHVPEEGALAYQEVFFTTHSDEEGKNMVLKLENLGLEILNPFLASSGVGLGGHVSGDVRSESEGVGQKPDGRNEGGMEKSRARRPHTTGKLDIAGLTFNDELLGDIVVSSTMDDLMQRLNLKAYSTIGDKIMIDGYMSMTGADPELHFDAGIKDIALGVIRPFVSSFSSRVEGVVSANLALRGTMGNPIATGAVIVEDGLMKVDFLNVAYSFADTIVLDSSAVRLDGFRLRDPDGGMAKIDGMITYCTSEQEASVPIRLNLTLESPGIVCMNTSRKDNAGFYGRIVASASGRVSGMADNLNIVIDARTLEGTTLNVPINDKRQMEQVDYIHFIGEDFDYGDDEIYGIYGHGKVAEVGEVATGTLANQGQDEGTSKYNLVINVGVTTDMLFHMPMEFSSLDVDVKARGDGDLQLTLGTGRDFGVAGLYEISGGTLMLDLLGVVSKEFAIDDGSTITLPGNLDGILFDIGAVLSQRVNLSSLTGSLSSTDSQKPIQVENVISLNGSLSSPEVSFDIRLPGADQSTQEEVFSYIDRNSERDMLTQTVYLLVSKRFYNSSASTELVSNGGTSNQAYGIMMGTLGSVLSDMVQVVDVNFDYQSGNELTTDQYAVDISKEWNKFYFETTFGFGGESREMAVSGKGNNNMTGDMLVGYKINPRLHLFVFNRSNTNDYTRSDLPYKQGVGLKYTRDFDRFAELFRRKKRKVEN